MMITNVRRERFGRGKREFIEFPAQQRMIRFAGMGHVRSKVYCLEFPYIQFWRLSTKIHISIAPIAVTATRVPFAKHVPLEVIPLPNMSTMPHPGVVCLGGAFNGYMPNDLKYETAIRLFWNTTFVIGAPSQRADLKVWDTEKRMPSPESLSYAEFNKGLLSQYL